MTKPKGGLGKGLGALIPTAVSSHTTSVDIDLIVPNPRQPRQALDPATLLDLAESIKEHGVLQPLIVSEVKDQPGGARVYQLIAGERRWRAAKMAGLAAVPIVIKEATPQQALELALVENIQRADLGPLEEAAAYRQLLREFGLTQEEVATRVGRSRAAVANALRLLHLPDEIKEALSSGAISEGHARALLGLADPQQQILALKVVIDKGLNVRQTEDLVRRLPEETDASPRTPSPADPETAAIEGRFRSVLGTKVQILRTRRGGKVVIHFYSEEELQGLYEAIVREE